MPKSNTYYYASQWFHLRSQRAAYVEHDEKKAEFYQKLCAIFGLISTRIKEPLDTEHIDDYVDDLLKELYELERA